MRRRDGFTLLEVMLAVFVLGTVVGALSVLVSQNIKRLADARRDLEALRIGEERMQQLIERAAAGDVPEFGVEEGTLDDPNSGFGWQLTVEPYSIPMPPEHAEDPLPSSVFAPWSEQPSGVEPSLRLVSLRVYPLERDPEEVEPFLTLLVEPIGSLGVPAPNPETPAGTEATQ